MYFRLSILEILRTKNIENIKIMEYSVVGKTEAVKLINIVKLMILVTPNSVLNLRGC